MAHDESNEILARLSVNFEEGNTKFLVLILGLILVILNRDIMVLVYMIFMLTLMRVMYPLLVWHKEVFFTSIMIELSKSLVVRKALKVV